MRKQLSRALSPRTRLLGGAVWLLLICILSSSVYLATQHTRVVFSEQERQAHTKRTLATAKSALLGYLAVEAMTAKTPGQLPCPEDLNGIGKALEGTADSSCKKLPAVGRFPWKTLGLPKLLDHHGQPLWYVVGGLRTPPINDTSRDTLTVDDATNANAVALIIAPGAPIDTRGLTNTTAGCSPQRQSQRKTIPLIASEYLECGNAAFTQFFSSRNDGWSNDLAIGISAADVIHAIEGTVAARLQRELAPQIDQWRSENKTRWGRDFLPYAAPFVSPEQVPLTDASQSTYCGVHAVREGWLPLSLSENTRCPARWTQATVAAIQPTHDAFTLGDCRVDRDALRCPYVYAGAPQVSVTLITPRAAMGFYIPPTLEQLNNSKNMNPQITQATMRLSALDGAGSMTVSLTLPYSALPRAHSLTIAHPQSAGWLDPSSKDNPLQWFFENAWYRSTYYAIAAAHTANPTGGCDTNNTSGCLRVNDLPSHLVNQGARLVLVLAGQRLAGQAARPSNLRSAYFEGANATPNDDVFSALRQANRLNDRIALCPLRMQFPQNVGVLCP